MKTVTMRLVLLLVCIIGAKAASKDYCVSLNYKLYKEDELLTNIDRPYLPAVDKSTNDLYFSYSVNAKTTKSKSVRYNLNTGKSEEVDIPIGYSHATDSMNLSKSVYIGGWKDIYELSPPDHEPKVIVTVPGNWITDMHFLHPYLMYATYPEHKMYMYGGVGSKELEQFSTSNVTHFVFDDDGIAFFSNDTGMYSMTFLGNVEQIHQTNKEYEVRDMSKDNYGNIYACLADGLYLVDRNNNELQKVYNIDNAFGVAFDANNNIIYSTVSSLLRLTAADESECDEYYDDE